MQVFKSNLLNNWVPRGLIHIVQILRGSLKKTEYKFIGYSWMDKNRNTNNEGWYANSVNKTRLRNWQEYCISLEGSGPLGINRESMCCPMALDISIHNMYIAFAYAISLSCHCKKRLSVLDFGGGLGGYYLLGRKVLPEVDLSYTVIELPHVCIAGRKLLPEVNFVDTEIWHNMTYDFVFSSSAIHYTKDWRSTMKLLIRCAERYLFITRMPFVQKNKSFVMLQNSKVYGTQYQGWVINKDEFLSFCDENGLKLSREFVNYIGPYIHNAPEQNIYMGFLFEKR